MRKLWLLTPALCLAAVAALAQGASTPSTPATAAPKAGTQATTRAATKATPAQARHFFTPGDITWGPAPPSLPAGAQIAVLSGDPGASTGVFTVRVRMPDGYRVMPHTHPKREHVAVLSGTLRMGMGKQWSDASLKDLPAGGFAYLDPTMAHFVQSRGETVLQLHGEAPLAMNYVNPADDPSRTAPKPTTSASR